MTLKEIKEKADKLIIKNEQEEAYILAHKLEIALKENTEYSSNITIRQELIPIIFKLYIFGLVHISEEILQKIISLNILEALQISFPKLNNESIERDFIDRLEMRYWIYIDKDLIKEKQSELLPLLKQNTQHLGNINLPITIEKPSEESTVKNWLDYYDRKVGFGKNDTFMRGKFLTSDVAVQELNTEDKELLRKLLTLYDYLKIGPPKTNVYHPSTPPQSQAQPQQTPPPRQASTPNNVNTLPPQRLPKRNIL